MKKKVLGLTPKQAAKLVAEGKISVDTMMREWFEDYTNILKGEPQGLEPFVRQEKVNRKEDK